MPAGRLHTKYNNCVSACYQDMPRLSTARYMNCVHMSITVLCCVKLCHHCEDIILCKNHCIMPVVPTVVRLCHCLYGCNHHDLDLHCYHVLLLVDRHCVSLQPHGNRNQVRIPSALCYLVIFSSTGIFTSS